LETVYLKDLVYQSGPVSHLETAYLKDLVYQSVQVCCLALA
jgi:hypothetical protein